MIESFIELRIALAKISYGLIICQILKKQFPKYSEEEIAAAVIKELEKINWKEKLFK